MAELYFDVSGISPNDLKIFLNSPIWKQLEIVYIDRANLLRDEIAVAPSRQFTKVVYDTQGNRKGIDIVNSVEYYQGALAELLAVLSIPETIKEEIEGVGDERGTS